MHPPSALLAGTVLTFGFAALTNLYLPAMISPPVTVASVETSSQPLGPSPEAVAFLNARADTYVPVVAIQEAPSERPIPEQVSQIAQISATELAGSAPEPTKPVVAPKTASLRPATRKPTETPVAKRATEPTDAPAQTAKTSAPSVQFTESKAPVVFAKPQASTPSPGAMSVSAVSGDRAWVRVGDSKTLAVTTGDSVPGMGRIQSVAADAVTFDSGIVLKVPQ